MPRSTLQKRQDTLEKQRPPAFRPIEEQEVRRIRMLGALFAPAVQAKTALLGEVIRQYAVDTRNGLRYVRRGPGMVPLLATLASVNLLFMPCSS